VLNGVQRTVLENLGGGAEHCEQPASPWWGRGRCIYIFINFT